ncbi:MAG: hypothetical protein D3917_18860, partial [Candidatus Electrothrix sp. AX5]|nr:hypothetical protein [Candidatus Electrothrix sp. AX5]
WPVGCFFFGNSNRLSFLPLFCDATVSFKQDAAALVGFLLITPHGNSHNVLRTLSVLFLIR